MQKRMILPLATSVLGMAMFGVTLNTSMLFAQAAPGELTPSAPAPAADAAPSFPKPDPENFTATSPSVDTVNAFLTQLWGYDPNRSWQVEAIQKTVVPGISKVVVYVAEKGGKQQPQGTAFIVLQDGKYAVAGDDVFPFGPKPFAANREILQKRASGPALGSEKKDLLLVEFSDLQCPHCKDAEPNVSKLLQDFPNARIVYQNFPLVKIHPAALKAAEYGTCVGESGAGPFFKYVDAVFETQASLTPEGTDAALNAAVTKAGGDAAKVAACVATAKAKSTVDESLKLGQDLGVNSTPTLFVNGRPVPFAGVPYETLKQIINFQAVQDGVGGSSAPTLGK